MTNMFAHMDESTGEIFLSAYSPDDPLWENNHIVLAEMRGKVISKHSSSLNVLGNVLEQAGIRLITE